MNKIILYWSCILVLLAGCVKDEKDLFNDPSSIRMQKALDECKEVLLSSTNGWYMEYFPNTSQYGGYILFTNFQEDGSVAISAESSVSTQTETSLYSFKKDNGPVLSFDTYNSILHEYSDPKNDGVGYEGDFEFVIQNITNDYIVLRGKKWGNLSFLNKITTNVTKEQYLSFLINMDDELFPSNALPPFWTLITDNNDTLYLANQSLTRTFIVSDSKDFDKYSTVGTIPTLSGIHFNPALEAGGEKYEFFNLEDQGDKLIAVDGKSEIIGADVETFFSQVMNTSTARLIFSDNLMGNLLNSNHDKVKNSIEAIGRVFTYMGIVNHTTYGESLVIRSSRNNSFADGFIPFEFNQLAGSKVELKFNGFTNQTDPNGKRYYEEYEGVKEFVDALQGTYDIQIIGNSLTPTIVKFIDITNENNWFELNLIKN